MNRNMPAAKVKPRMPRNGRLVTKDLSQASSTFRKIGMILYLGAGCLQSLYSCEILTFNE